MKKSNKEVLLPSDNPKFKAEFAAIFWMYQRLDAANLQIVRIEHDHSNSKNLNVFHDIHFLLIVLGNLMDGADKIKRMKIVENNNVFRMACNTLRKRLKPADEMRNHLEHIWEGRFEGKAYGQPLQNAKILGAIEEWPIYSFANLELNIKEMKLTLTEFETCFNELDVVKTYFSNP